MHPGMLGGDLRAERADRWSGALLLRQPPELDLRAGAGHRPIEEILVGIDRHRGRCDHWRRSGRRGDGRLSAGGKRQESKRRYAEPSGRPGHWRLHCFG